MCDQSFFNNRPKLLNIVPKIIGPQLRALKAFKEKLDIWLNSVPDELPKNVSEIMRVDSNSIPHQEQVLVAEKR